MEFVYQFSDRGGIDPLWKLTWKEYLLRWGRTRWARAKMTENGDDSLRSMIAFFIDPAPTAEEVDRILAEETIRWTVRRSSPQFRSISELIYNTPGLRRHGHFIGCDANYFTVLMAAAVEAYLRGRISRYILWPVFKLHSTTDPSQWLRLSHLENKALKAALAGFDMWSPIYQWQGPAFLEGEQWANCLGVSDTRRFIAFVLRAWNENWPIPRLKNLNVEIRPHRLALLALGIPGCARSLCGR